MDLLTRFVQGDVEAFEKLFRQFQGDVYGWTLRIVRDPGIAEDLTVETFWKIYQARARFHPDAPFGSWARRIATNLAIDHVRRRRPEMELSEEMIGVVRSPDSLVMCEMREKIARAFERLPTKLRVTATLALIEERPYQEIADALGKPVATIRTRVFRATRILRDQLNRAGVKP